MIDQDATVEQGIQRGWIVTRRTELRGRYWRWCKANRRPFVVVKPGTRYCRVALDMDTVYPAKVGDAGLTAQLDLLHSPELRGVQGFTGNYSYWYGVPLELAERVARCFLSAGEAGQQASLEALTA